jgi:hydroxymethylpyrimidine/phosphomethylpyrimidine kinase
VDSDFGVQAAKTGMLAEAPVVEAVTERVADLDAPLVVDPVMVATSGDRLLSRAGEHVYEDLLTEATLVTPNRDEAAVLTGVEPTDTESAREAGDALLDLGADAALVTGGHGDGDTLVDVLVISDAIDGTARKREFAHPRVATDAIHGSGCVLSSAIAARLATGADLESAVEDATGFMERAIRYPLDVGQGPGAVHPLVELRDRAQRGSVAETVATLVDELVDRGDDAGTLVPEVGMNVVGATPYAESVGETLAVEGRIRGTSDGVAVARGVRAGASSHMARFLLSAREFVPELRFAANVRNDAATRERLEELDGPTAAIDRTREPADAATMNWSAREVYADCDSETAGGSSSDPPVAVFDDGDVGKEPMIRVVARDAETLAARLWTISGAAHE